jgi:undecaprenyl-diphosphatase
MSPLVMAVILGALQGITEFLPISSSGHLILAQAFFGLREPELAFDITLHLGTLTAVFIFYRRPLGRLFRELRFLPGAALDPARLRTLYGERPDFRFGLLGLAGCLPTALLGLGLRDLAATRLASVESVGLALLATGVLLASLGRRGGTGRTSLTLRDALVIGLVQGVAVIPGLSRSGWTIGAGLWLGLERETAARYSFILSAPAILGAALLESRGDWHSLFAPGDFLAGFLAAALGGCLALAFLARLLKTGRFSAFAWWCWAAGGAALAWTFLGP